MFKRFSTEAFMLDSFPRREADKVFLFFSKKYGKIFAVGKSIRKISSKLNAGLDFFALSRVEFIQGRNYKILVYAEIKNEAVSFRRSLHRLKAAFKTRDFLSRVIKGTEPDLAVWQVFSSAVEALKKSSLPLFSFLIYQNFSWRLLQELGYEMNFKICAECKKEVASFGLFSQKGFLCPDCSKKTHQKENMVRLKENERKVLEKIRRASLDDLEEAEVSLLEAKKAENILDFFLEDLY